MTSATVGTRLGRNERVDGGRTRRAAQGWAKAGPSPAELALTGIKSGACGAAGPASAPRSTSGRPRPAHAGPHLHGLARSGRLIRLAGSRTRSTPPASPPGASSAGWWPQPGMTRLCTWSAASFIVFPTSSPMAAALPVVWVGSVASGPLNSRIGPARCASGV